jgi:transposase-like protein
MNTRAIADEYRLAHWAQIVRERQESGLSIKTYCESAGFHENVYYYWQRKLREAACKELSKVQYETTSLQPAGFAEIRLAESPTLPIQSVVHQNQVRVDVAGVQITADCEYPIGMLTILIQGLRRPC